jgi:hypothetical protein
MITTSTSNIGLPSLVLCASLRTKGSLDEFRFLKSPTKLMQIKELLVAMKLGWPWFTELDRG